MRFLVGDTHFDHRNIIDYCDRPYDSVEEMNETLVANWNDAVATDDDDVVFLGDLTVTDDFATFADRLDRLNGTIDFVLGDHDETVMPTLDSVRLHEQFRFTHRDVPFYCVHDPADAPESGRGGRSTDTTTTTGPTSSRTSIRTGGRSTCRWR